MDYSDAFRFVNLGVGIFMVLGGIAQFFIISSPREIVVGIYAIAFGLGTALLEFQIPPQISRYASFMFSFLGRGIFYILIGCIVFANDHWYTYAAGGIVAAVGVAYAALEFVPSIEPPANMREADASWGAEQI